MPNKKSPDIALFIPSMSGGGAERVFSVLANAFCTQGLQVDVVLVDATGTFLSVLDERINIIDLKKSSASASLFSLARYLKTARPVALLSALDYANVTAMVAWQLAGKPCRIYLSEHSTPSMLIRQTSLFIRVVLPSLMKHFYPLANHIVAVSDGVAADLSAFIQMPAQSIRTIYNPVDLSQIRRAAALELSDIWFEQGEVPVFLAVGRLSAEKNFSMLIKAFEHCRASNRCRLLILGEGPERFALEQQIANSRFQEDIRLAGFCSNPYAYMRSAAALVLSSNTEGLPTVLMEALACNTQIIATDCPHGPKEILQQGRWGTLVPVGDALVLAQSMSAFLQQPSHFSVAERADAFNIENATAQYLQLIFGDEKMWQDSR